MKITSLDQITLSDDMKTDPRSYAVAASIIEDGEKYDKKRPIVVEKETGIILDGNHRFQLFLEAGRISEVSILLILESDYYDILMNNEDCEIDEKAILIGEWFQN